MTILVSYQAVPLTFYNKIAPMVVRIRKGVHWAVKSRLFNEVVKYPQNKMFWEIFSFTEVHSLMPIESMMNLCKYIDAIKKSHSRYVKGISFLFYFASTC